MSFFKNAKGVIISGGQFNNIRGNFNQWNDNRHTSNVNSNNTTTTNNVNSHNDNSWHGPGGNRHRNDNRRQGTNQPRNNNGPHHEPLPSSPEAAPKPPQDAPTSGGYTYNQNSHNTRTENNHNSHNDYSTTFHEQTRPSGPDHVKSDPQKPLRDPAQKFMSLSVPTSPQEQASSFRRSSAATAESQHAVRGAHPVKQSPISAATARAPEPGPSILLSVPTVSSSSTTTSLQPSNSEQTYGLGITPTSLVHPSASAPQLSTPAALSKATTNVSSMLSSRKVTVGTTATRSRVETDKPIRIKLEIIKESGARDPLFFLKDIVDPAIEILSTIEAVDIGDIRTDLLDLALDAYAVVYITVVMCETKAVSREGLSEAAKSNVEALGKNLDNLYPYISKILARGALKRYWRRNKDAINMQRRSAELATWLAEFKGVPYSGRQFVSESFNEACRIDSQRTTY